MSRSAVLGSRRALFATVCALGATGSVALVGSATAAHSAPPCSNATLDGTYTFASDGWTVSNGTATPFALAGVETYDGAGSATGTVTVSLNGVVTPATPNTATYSIAANCIGTAAFTNSGVTTHFDLYVDPSGDSFKFVGTDQGQVTSSTETRVHR
jgi:hypothetical protein